MSKEKIILNIGGKKYETLRSTFTAQPKTLLGKIFQNKNEYMKYLINENEYFFDRNGEMFYYILEFFRTGKLLCPNGSYKKLEEELDYFQIPFNKSELASEVATNTVDRFISFLEKLIIIHCENFLEKIILKVGESNISISNQRFQPLFSNDRYFPFEKYAFNILNKIEKLIGEHLVKTFSELELKWNCVRNNNLPSFTFDIIISFSIKKLFQLKITQTYITPHPPLDSILEEKIILNVGGKKYETLRSILTAQPETLLGVMFQDRNKCLSHPINGNEYFIDRNSEIFDYIIEYYRTGKILWPIEFEKSSKITSKQLEEELDYFQIPFNRSTIFCSLALESSISTFKRLIVAFEELVIHCCENFRNKISVYIRPGKINVDNNKESSFLINSFKMNAFTILTKTEKQIGDHLSKTFCKLKLKWKCELRKDLSNNDYSHGKNKSRYLYICISFSIEKGLKF
ncbi:3540_t:CDS:2 [Dentiscutata erythropus]|uniref:3540_t:CDS:1 n=1 Tax=Dentiscutata erythropus TaxID=1348616 RepID=A0A9N9NCR7_9GLOM|nr:3540_t:CDS:2 [Dentiscutata erythropus]